jgi:hypothetical protein
MSILWLQRDEVPASQNAVRRNTAPVDNHEAPSEQSHAPEPNDVRTDNDPNLGLVNTQLASVWHEPEQYAPSWAPVVDNNHLQNDIVDRQVGSSGTAAQREMAGQFGHGTMGYAIGIEPVYTLTDAGGLGNDYFVRNERNVQDTMGREMSTPPGYDQDTSGRVAAAGEVNAREASASAYNAFYSAVTG